MFHATFRVIRISMIMARGAKSPSMATCGIPRRSKWAGRRIATATGTGLARGAGLGVTMLLGGLLPSTTAAGLTSAALGAGARDRCLLVPSTDRHSSALSAAESVLVSVEASVV